MTALLEARNLSKNFGALKAVRGVSFSIAPGQIVGLLGPNGAGKTTTMRLLSGFLAPSEGDAFIAGFSIQQQRIQAQSKLGYLPEASPLSPDLRVGDYLPFIAGAYGLPKSACEKVVELLELQSVWRKPIDTLSKGFKRRVGLAQALIADPPALILDEPTDGLDPNQKDRVRDILRNLKNTKAILLSTHLLEEVSALCGRVLLIDRGEIKADQAVSHFDRGQDLAELFRRQAGDAHG